MLAAGMPVGVYAAEAPEYGESIKEKIAVEGAAIQEPAVEETSVEEALGEGGEGAEKKKKPPVQVRSRSIRALAGIPDCRAAKKP